jgi:hypothetical protein
LPIGIEDFGEMMTGGYYYVDKTQIIKELLDWKGKVNLFLRPRRFGKTLALSTLKYFFEDTRNAEANAANQALFNETNIMKCGDVSELREHMTAYPVISLTLKSAKQPTFELAYDSLTDAIAEEYKRRWFLLDSIQLKTDRETFKAIAEGRGSAGDYNKSLKFLSKCLCEACGKKVVILIDEYDVPLESAYFAGFYDKMIGFIRSLFESALMTNENLEFAVITGCLRISKESIFTGLNNLKIISITNETYGEYFGFTQE